jgi:drug/metabolite transporter (DMT)-like permease
LDVEMTSPAATLDAVEQAAPRANRRLWIVLSLLSVYIIWGTTYLGISVALQSFPPYLMMGIRFVTAGTILFIVMRVQGAALPTLTQTRNAAIIGALLLLGGMGSVAIAEQWVASGLAATMIATMPLWVTVFSMMWGGVVPSRWEWLGIALGIVGVALLSFEGNLSANPLGIALLLFSCVSWGLGSVWSKKLALPTGAMANAVEMLAGGALLIAAGLLRGEALDKPITIPALLALAYLTTFGSLATITAYTYLLRTVRPGLATSYAFVNPVIALLLGVWIGGETLTGSAWIALPVILIGVAFVALRRR